MSNIYIQEPPTFGKVLLKTSAGDIDIELWSKEAPKACRNFIQLCLEGYYNGTIFHRVVKDFIVQGGDPTGTGEGGESIYGQTFKDEFHTRLRFCRRGLVAMANAGKDDNGSQFFFTMGPTQELQNKHTVFGKTSVLDNPFPDIVPRVQASDAQREGKRKRDKKTGVKDFKLLSFGAEAEEDEEETERENKKFSGRSKSTHDLLDDPKLSAMPAVPQHSEELDRVKNKLKSSKSSKAPSKTKVKTDAPADDEQELEAYTLGQDKREERRKQAEAIKQEYRELRRDMKRKNEEDDDAYKKQNKDKETSEHSEIYMEYKKEKELYEDQKKKLPAKGADRESFTMALLAKFQKKLESVKAETDDGEEHVEEENTEVPLEDDEADLGKDGCVASYSSRKMLQYWQKMLTPKSRKLKTGLRLMIPVTL
ncbi:hypothetical protein B566_EDAN006691 [Ephemera danica]|nr:hypothetical protein B566_EDAN006691 [Ephemera danica]